ncbi:unnamed protein product [Trifolium pratense]|uniref:Uncharacterized protein n=1 Tax=Trifolium pratense TaxID=57577 RepID=A0ACB0I7Z7_TRIPR|nr:unnamed protein product [Trifolium pratense]
MKKRNSKVQKEVKIVTIKVTELKVLGVAAMVEDLVGKERRIGRDDVSMMNIGTIWSGMNVESLELMMNKIINKKIWW